VLITLGVAAGLFWYSNHLLAPMADSGAPIAVDIPPGANASLIAKRLKDAGLIRSEFAFKTMARLYGGTADMKAGEYRIPPTLGVIQIIDRLVAGDAEAQWVVIPEGYTLSQIATRLDDRRLVSAPEFIRAAERKPKAFGVSLPVSHRSVNGYLMPNSYKFPKQASNETIIKTMLKTWNDKVYRPNQKLFARSDMPLEKIVIIASMIEREAKAPEDRELISAVIRNRLHKKMPLQIDATVLYALGKHKGALSYADLRVDNPYNTYKNKGLPPGPICNPGLASILAALKPAKKDYLYYVAQPDGTHIFSRTGAEHIAAIAKVKAMRKEAAANGG
jgi:UPF0755 protein